MSNEPAPILQPPRGETWTYQRCALIRIIDGDTIVAAIDLGFRVKVQGVTLRMWGYDAPEKRTPEGHAAILALTPLIGMAPLRLTTIRGGRTGEDEWDKYGRLLAWVDVLRTDGTALNVNQWMVENGYGVPYFGGKRTK